MANTIMVPISDIILDPRLQMREKMDFEVIDEYSEDIFDLPPGKIVMGAGGEMWLTAGWHRYHAHVKAKQDKMKCDVRDGTFLDALAEAAGENHGHGLKRTAADKRRAVMSLLKEKLWQDRSDRMIATACKVSWPFVGKIRQEMSGGNVSTSERIGADGKNYSSKVTQPSLPQDDESVPFCDEPELPVPPTPKPSYQTDNHKPSTNGRPKKAPEPPPGDEEDEMVDDEDYPVPARLRAIFAEKNTIRKLKSMSDQSYNILIEMEKKPWYKLSQENYQGDQRYKIQYSAVMVVLANAMRRVEPLTVHQPCRGDGCKDCKQRGYLTNEDAKEGASHAN
jgi:hypothetical protein